MFLKTSSYSGKNATAILCFLQPNQVSEEMDLFIYLDFLLPYICGVYGMSHHPVFSGSSILWYLWRHTLLT